MRGDRVVTWDIKSLTMLESPYSQGRESDAQQGHQGVGGTRAQNTKYNGGNPHCQSEALENERQEWLIAHFDLQRVDGTEAALDLIRSLCEVKPFWPGEGTV